jgi:EF hand
VKNFRGARRIADFAFVFRGVAVADRQALERNAMSKPFVILAAAAAFAGTFVTVAAANEPGIPYGEKLFHQLDKNNDSRLELGELKPQSERRFMRLDADKDGKVTAAEIDAWLVAIAERRRQRILDHMDKDGDGAISQAELDTYIGGLFTAADTDADGGVTIIEAQAYHAAKRKAYYDARKAKSQPN